MADALDTFPPELHYSIEHQVWARLDADGLATVGITSLGIRQSGEIYMCRPKSVGSVLEQGRSVGVVELAKSVVSVKSPLHGEVVEVNPLLEEQPEWVHRDPYGRGWLVRVRPTELETDLPALLHGVAVRAAMAHHAWLSRLDGE